MTRLDAQPGSRQDSSERRELVRVVEGEESQRHSATVPLGFGGRVGQNDQRLSRRQHLEDVDVTPYLFFAEGFDVLRTQPAAVAVSDRMRILAISMYQSQNSFQMKS